MVFFMLFAFYLFIQAKKADGNDRKLVKRLKNLSAVSFGLMMASKYFPHYMGLNMLYHHNYSMRERTPGEQRWTTPLSFFVIMGAGLSGGQSGNPFPEGMGVYERLLREKSC
jgi:hypothetical protein